MQQASRSTFGQTRTLFHTSPQLFHSFSTAFLQLCYSLEELVLKLVLKLLYLRRVLFLYKSYIFQENEEDWGEDLGEEVQEEDYFDNKSLLLL